MIHQRPPLPFTKARSDSTHRKREWERGCRTRCNARASGAGRACASILAFARRRSGVCTRARVRWCDGAMRARVRWCDGAISWSIQESRPRRAPACKHDPRLYSPWIPSGIRAAARVGAGAFAGPGGQGTKGTRTRGVGLRAGCLGRAARRRCPWSPGQ